MTAPDLIGVVEAAEILGLSRQRVHQLIKADRFPYPIGLHRSRPLWLKSEIERLALIRAKQHKDII